MQKRVTFPQHRVASFSVDIDSLYLYLGLYGNRQIDSKTRRELTELTYRWGVFRFLNLFRETGCKATFFVVGQDLEVDTARQVCRRAVSLGHELANHTYSHPYDLTYRNEKEIENEINKCNQAIRRSVGYRPVGFRAPGYNINRKVRGVLSRLGYSYDSSPLPSYPYLLTKYAIMGVLALTGKKSSSVFGNPFMAFTSRNPYIKDGVLTFPVAVSKYLRLPLIGTFLTFMPEPVFRHMLSALKSSQIAIVEFHAVDLMDMEDGLPQELEKQKDLLLPVARKRERLRQVLETLKQTHQVVTLEQLSKQMLGISPEKKERTLF